jgi:hypothetical protein
MNHGDGDAASGRDPLQEDLCAQQPEILSRRSHHFMTFEDSDSAQVQSYVIQHAPEGEVVWSLRSLPSASLQEATALMKQGVCHIMRRCRDHPWRTPSQPDQL